MHGLRALGLKAGDDVAVVLPNSVDFYAVFFAAIQAGLYFTPINHHLVGPEIAYIVDDCEAKVLDRRRPLRRCVLGRREGDRRCRPTPVRGRRGRRLPPLRRPRRRPADHAARGPHRRGGDALHVGHHRPAEGRAAPAPPADPDEAGHLTGVPLHVFGIQPHDGNVHICGSPLYHTAVLHFAATSLHLGHTVVLMDKWTPESMLQLIEDHKVTHSHMVPTQFHRLLSLPEEVRASYDVSSLRHMIHAAAPCPPDVKRRMIEWWGDAIYEYYAATEGGGTLVTAEQWLAKPGTVGMPWPTSEISIFDDDGEDVPPGDVGTVYMRHGRRRSSSTSRTRTRPRPTAGPASSPSATSATSTTTATCSSATARPT